MFNIYILFKYLLNIQFYFWRANEQKNIFCNQNATKMQPKCMSIWIVYEAHSIDYNLPFIHTYIYNRDIYFIEGVD